MSRESGLGGDSPLSVAGYDIIREVGRGAFGEVLLARHRILGRLVAVKHIPSAALADPDAIARFRREARVLAALDHPGVVRVYDFKLGEGRATLIMEYVPGESLRARLDRGPISPAAAIVVLSDVADALAAAAERGVVHRDVKPANVFLLPDGRAKLGDFGIARVTTDPAVFRTSTGQVSGSPAYMSPESIFGSGEPDARGDDYSFAVMAYEMFVGELPFVADDLPSLLGMHQFAAPRPPGTVVPGFPAAATDALLGGLDKAPANRLPAAALVQRLRAVPSAEWPAAAAAGQPGSPPRAAPTLVRPRAGAGTELPAPAAGAVETGLAPAAPHVEPPVYRPPARRRGSLRVRPVWLAAAGTVLVLAVAGVLLSARDTGPRSLDLRGATVTVSPANGVGRCPRAHYDFVARIATNGARGTLRIQWVQPDGQRTAVSMVRVRAGQEQVIARLQFDVTGDSTLHGAAVLRVLTPREYATPPVAISYDCP